MNTHISLQKIKAYLKTYYSRIIKRFGYTLHLDYPLGYIESTFSSNLHNQPFNKAQINGKKPPITFLIGTGSHGLILYDHGKLFTVISSKGLYGITRLKNRWFAFHRTLAHGKIVSFELANNKAINLTTHLFGFSTGIHQIDLIGNNLQVVDTYNNRILVYNKVFHKRNQNWRNFDHVIYPNGKLNIGRKSKNYNHFNSIFYRHGTYYLVAHNETNKTEKPSEIWKLNKNFKVDEVIPVDGANCHNYFTNDSIEIICNSIPGKVLINRKNLLDFGTFTRGLAVSHDYYIIGGSGFQLDREKRDFTDGYIYILDKAFNTISKITIPSTQINEIRRIDAIDYGLSNANIKNESS